MAEIATYLFKWRKITIYIKWCVTISSKMELVKRNLRKVEITGGINLYLKVK